MSSELKLLEKWSRCGFFDDTTDINLELKIAFTAENIYNSECPVIEGMDLKMLMVVSVIKLLKEGIEDLNPQDIYEKLIEFLNDNQYNEGSKIEWINNFLNQYKINLNNKNNNNE